ncbi:MAG: hypothetical protein ACK55Z_27655, partial [bacterium]
TAHCTGATAIWNSVPQKAPMSHHPQPLTLAIATALITMSSSILTIPIRNRMISAIVAVGPMYWYIGTRW